MITFGDHVMQKPKPAVTEQEISPQIIVHNYNMDKSLFKIKIEIFKIKSIIVLYIKYDLHHYTLQAIFHPIIT